MWLPTLLHLITLLPDCIAVWAPGTFGCPELSWAFEKERSSMQLGQVDFNSCRITRSGINRTQLATETLDLLSSLPNSTSVQYYKELFTRIAAGDSLHSTLTAARHRIEHKMLRRGFESDVWELQTHAAVLRRITCEIPNIVHFIKTDGDPDRFELLHFLAVKAAHTRLKPDAIYFWGITRPRGDLWERAAQFMTFVQLYPVIISLPPSHSYLCIQYTPAIEGKQIQYAAHHADLLRLQILWLHGGIYMDWDGI